MTARHQRALLDTSVVIHYPVVTVAQHAEAAAVSAITLAELSYGLHTPDPLVNAAREQRYQWIVSTFDASRSARRRPARTARYAPTCEALDGIRSLAGLTCSSLPSR